MSPVQTVTYVSGMDPGDFGAGEGIRTLDPHVGNVMLYQLSYSRAPGKPSGH